MKGLAWDSCKDILKIKLAKMQCTSITSFRYLSILCNALSPGLGGLVLSFLCNYKSINNRRSQRSKSEYYKKSTTYYIRLTIYPNRLVCKNSAYGNKTKIGNICARVASIQTMAGIAPGTSRFATKYTNHTSYKKRILTIKTCHIYPLE